MAGQYNAGTAYVNIKPKLDRFAQELKTKLALVNADHKVNIRADTTGFASDVRLALATIPDAHDIKVNVNADTAKARTAILSLQADKAAELSISADTAAAEAQINHAARDREAEIDVKADTSKVATDIVRKLGKRKAFIKIEADTSGAQKAIVILGNRMKGLDRYQRRIVLLSTGFTLLGVAIAGAIAPLASFTSGLISAAGVLATLPALLGGAIAGVAGLVTGLSGVGKAFGAMGKSAGGAGGNTAKAMKSAQRAVESAQRGIGRAERGVRDATEGVEDAYKRIADAERKVTEAQNKSKQAQSDLNRARKEATRELRDMNEQLMDAALDEEGAVLAVARAKQALEEALASGDSDQLDIAEADLSYRRALDSLQDIRRENNRLAESVSQANRAGVEGSEPVVEAHEAIYEAQQAEIDAADDLADAHRNLRDSFERLDDAELDLADAHRDLQDAMEAFDEAMAGGGGGADPFAEAMANLSEEARKFVQAIRDLGPAWKEVRLAAQDALFKDLGEAITTLADRQLPVLKDGFVDINTEINKGIRASIQKFSTEIAAIDFRTFLQNTAGLFQGLALAAAPLSQIWIDLATVGSEYLPRMGGAVAGTFTGWSESISNARADGSLNEMIDNGIAAFSRLKSFIGDVGGLIAGVFRGAAEAGDPFFFKVEEAFSKMHEWSDSLEGRATIKDFFHEAAQALDQAMPVLSAIGGFLTGTLTPIVESIVTGLAPGMKAIIDQIGETLNLGEGAFGAIGAGIGAVLSEMADLMDFLEPAHQAVFNLVEAFMRLPDAILFTVGAMAGLKKLGVLDFFSSLREGVQKLSVEMKAQVTHADNQGQAINRLTGWWRALETKSEVATRMGLAFLDATPNIDKARGSLRELNANLDATRAIAKRSGDRTGVLGAHMGVAAAQTKLFGQYAKGYAAAGMSAISSGAKGLIGFLGGPWGVALMVATAVIGEMVNAHNRAKEAQERMASTAHEAKEAQEELARAVAGTTGELGEEGIAAAAKVADASLNDFLAMGEQLDSWFKSSKGVEEYWKKLTGEDIVSPEQLAIVKADLSNAFKGIEDAARDAGIPMEEIGTIIAEGGPRYQELIDNLDSTRESGKLAKEQLEAARAEVELQIEAAQRVSPEMLKVRDAVKVLADEASTAEDRLSAMRTILQELGILPKDAERSMMEAAQAVDHLAESAADAADQTGDLGESLFGEDGKLRWDSANAQELFNQLDGLSDQLLKVAESGEDTDLFMAEKIEPVLATLQESFKLTDEQVQSLREQFALMPEVLDMLVSLRGADDVKAEFQALMLGMAGSEAGNAVEVPMSLATKDAVLALEEFGILVDKSEDGKNWVLEVEDEKAKSVLHWWATEGFSGLSQNPTSTLELDDSGFLLKTESAVMQLLQLDEFQANPLATMDISKLSEEQRKALEAVKLLDEQGPTPEAFMDIEKLSAEQQIALSKVFDLDEKTPTPHADMNTKEFDKKRDYTKREVDKIDNATAKPKIDADISPLRKTLEKAWEWLKSFGDAQEETFTNRGKPRPGGNTMDTAGLTLATGGQYRHAGYRLPKNGPGTERVDGFLAYNASGMPAARLDAGEWVINGRMSEMYHDELAAINAGTFPKMEGFATGGLFKGLPGYASGGIVQSGVQSVTPHQQQMWDIIRSNFPDAQLSSAKRFGGGNDFHDAGMAIDLGGGWANDLQAIASWIARNYPHSTELFWDPGPNIKNGQPTGAIGGHSDHVHWAMNGGLSPILENPGAPSVSISGGNTDGFGLGEYDIADAGDALDPLTTFRASDMSNPNNISYSRGDDLPTTWSGLAMHVAKPFIEGHTQDILKVLGVSNELPGFMRAYNQYTGQMAAQSARDRAQQSLTNGATDTYFSEFENNYSEMASYTGPTTLTGEQAMMVGVDPVGWIEETYSGNAGPVERWRPLAMQALSRHGYDPNQYIDAMMQQIDIESSGDPEAVNYWDDNYTVLGTPSGGLLQVIEPTYRDVRAKYASAFEGLVDDRFAPLTNLTAGVGATRRDWGGPGVWPTKDGYALGGFVSGLGGPTSDIIPAMLSDGEFVTRAMSTAVARPLLEAMNVDPGLAASMNQQFLDGNAGAGGGQPINVHYHIETNDAAEGMRRAEMQGRRAVRSMML